MSKWIEHIRDFAKRNNLTYGCALSDPKCSEEYRIKNPKPVKAVKGKKGKQEEETFEITPVKRKKIKKKLDLSKTEFVPLEEAIPDTEPKTKMIVATKPKLEPVDTITGPDFYLKLPFTEDYYLNPRALVEFENGNPYINKVLYGNIAVGKNTKDGEINKDMAKIEVKKLEEKYPPTDIKKSLIGLSKELKKVFPNLIENKKRGMKSGFISLYSIKKSEAEIDTEPKTKVIKKGRGMPLDRDMVMKLVGEGMKC
jgi:hypothetical protein